MHTPGYWHIGMCPGPIVYGPKGEQVADLTAELLPKEENTANARLIASAPELLEALQLAEATLQRLAPDGSRATCGTRDVIHATILKATGQS